VGAMKGRFAIGILLLGGAFFTPSGAAAELLSPFLTRNQNPFVQIFGLPVAETARLLPEGGLSVALVTDAANSFSYRNNGSQGIILDGETYRTTLFLRYAVSDRLEIGADLPYLYHSGGIFDGFIDGWHSFTGLPGGDREQVPRNRLRYLYREDGRERVTIFESTSGLGDLLFSAAVPVYGQHRGGRLLGVRTALKLPTGSASGLRGSGSTDFSVRLVGEDRQTFSAVNLFGSAGALLMTRGKIIAERQRQLVGFGTLGLGWQPYSRLALKMQLDGHSAFYDSPLKELGDVSAQLVLGGTLRLPGELLLDIAVSEDIIVYTAPDVVFHLALHRVF
jgi:hypothetical protein